MDSCIKIFIILFVCTYLISLLKFIERVCMTRFWSSNVNT